MKALVQSSQKAVDQASAPRKAFGKQAKYPWIEIQVGQSFAVGKDEFKSFKNLCSYVSRMGTKFKKRFTVVDHNTQYEVACVGLREDRQPENNEQPNPLNGIFKND